MKRLIVSAGLLAVGTASLQAATGPGLTPQETTKPWSVAASLRGFYDDNYATRPSDLKEGSGGIGFRPSAVYNRSMDQTFFRASYEFDLKYYFDRIGDDTDMGHDFQVRFDHRFSPRYRVEFVDSFLISQEPELLDPNLSSPLRSTANAMRNRAQINFTAQLTERLAAQLGFQNYYYDYEEDGPGSYSALLDRIEYYPRVDALYQLKENLTGIVGYQYGFTDFTSTDLLYPDPSSLPGTSRTFQSHYFYVGAETSLSSRLRLSGRAGAQFIDYLHLPGNDIGPYFDILGTYYYLPGSYVQLGVRSQFAATDIAGNGTAGNITGSQEYMAVYGNVSHRITPRITGNLLAQYQLGKFKGGTYDGQTDNFFIAGLNAEYRIDRFWSVEAGYNYDRLDSDIEGRGYDRNRVYVGVQARY
jgi:hypothetical protein